MTVLQILPRPAAELVSRRVARWFVDERTVSSAVVRSAQGVADATGRTQFIVTMPEGVCSEMVVTDRPVTT